MPGLLELAVKSSAVARFRDVTQTHLGAAPSQMMWRHYEAMGVAAARDREAVRRGVTTVGAWRELGARLRADFAGALGPLPAQQIEIVDRGMVIKRDLIIHKFLFSSSKDNWITGCLYLPKVIEGPLPGVVLACGHTASGKLHYAPYGALLARNGYAAISLDLPGQGERKIRGPGGICPYPTSTQHNVIGSRMILGGASMGWFMVQEIMAAVTLLGGRAEVDPKRIGITGGSGGGWLSVHAAAMDERIAAVAPAAAVRSYRHEIHVDDAEQTLFDMQRLGLDFPDLIGLLICPRPTLILANTRDIWSLEGTRYAHDEARRFYELHGRSEQLEMMTWERGHAYEPDQFAQTLGWFDRWLKPQAAGERRAEVEPENLPVAGEIQVTEQGNLYEEGRPSAATVFARFARSTLTGKKDVAGFVRMLEETTEVEETTSWAEMDRFDLAAVSGRTLCYAVESDLLLPVNVFMPARPRGIMLLLDECGRDEDRDWQLQRAAEGWLTFRPDLRGWGETAIEEDWADWEGWARRLYDGKRRRAHAMALMMGRSLPIERGRDVRHLVNIAGEIAPGLPITMHGRRHGAFVALLAGLADERIERVVLERLPASFEELLDADLPAGGCESFIHGWMRWGIKRADLVAALGDRLIEVL
jgi:hypothetical protein